MANERHKLRPGVHESGVKGLITEEGDGWKFADASGESTEPEPEPEPEPDDE
jgi:hypothetical protein